MAKVLGEKRELRGGPRNQKGSLHFPCGLRRMRCGLPESPAEDRVSLKESKFLYKIFNLEAACVTPGLPPLPHLTQELPDKRCSYLHIRLGQYMRRKFRKR